MDSMIERGDVFEGRQGPRDRDHTFSSRRPVTR